MSDLSPAALPPRLSCFSVPADSLHPPGRGGGRRGALLVLLVARMVPVAGQRLSILTLLQRGLLLLPALRPQLRPRQRAQAGQSDTAHAGQRQPDGRSSSRRQQRRGKHYHGGCLGSAGFLFGQRHGCTGVEQLLH